MCSLLLQDISFKRAPAVSQRTAINPESPWKLQQVQDAANHLQEAIHHIDDVDSTYHFKYVNISAYNLIVCTPVQLFQTLELF